ncbi:MAG: hypothetical protein ALECFALPRED_010274 [Alectoria fallacina]|uniref:Alpha-1,2-mannosyltransferase n=1 Tax=Alectoria fallacina TaxID=1903189 RepID=A0A8H3J8W7_9LECA|nr:MAG: hypothetical protein ALECFALPRED_010274 [Alectoria fallacina]
MFARPTRILTIILVAFGLFLTAAFLQRILKGSLRLSIFTISPSEANPPTPQILAFWEVWAKVIDAARPEIPAIVLQEVAQPAGIQPENERDRKPFNLSIGIPKTDVELLRQSHERLVGHANFSRVNEQATRLFSGTGIVTVAGGYYFAPAILSIRMLRKTNATLPVQVFLQNKSEYEKKICQEVLPALNAECFVIQDHLRKDNPVKVEHYQLKVLAILFSSFESVLYLDSDCMALLDPKELFDSEPFLSTGLVSWPDYWIATEDPIFYRIAGLPSFPKGLPARSSEAGQLLISKQTHLTTLLLAAYYNIYGPGIYYPILSQGAAGEGDKETFLAAAVVLDNPDYRVRHRLGTVGYHEADREFHGTAMVQYHPGDDYAPRDPTSLKQARPLFFHANSPKMNIAHLLAEDKVFYPGTEDRLRIWGPKESMTKMIGYDIEETVWVEIVEMACTLDDTLEDFRRAWQICERAQRHYRETFQSDATAFPT